MMRSVLVAGFLGSLLQTPAPALRIVVIEGEGAVNIIQQKTAVRPLVEVRDRNNVPVAGATVTFTIAGGGQPAAFAGGLQTLTVTTNAAGQAAASGLNALSSGAFQIQVQAAYQGQIATATISQTVVATAAAAAVAGSVAAVAGGGGISGLTIGIIGAAVGGGALVATQVGGGGGDDRGTVTTPVPTQTVVPTAPSPPSEVTFTGPFSGQIVVTTTSGNLTCVSTRSLSGTVTITLRDANTRGVLRTTGTVQEVSASASCSPLGGAPFNYSGDVIGGPSSLAFAFESSSTSTGIATVTATESVRFSGFLSGDSITGTLAYTHTTRGTGQGGNAIAGNGSTSLPVTLR